MSKTWHMRAAATGVLALGMLAGCGPMPEAPTATPAATAPGSEIPVATPATPATDALTLGDLAERVNAAWADVASYQLTFTGPAIALPIASGTPVATPVATPGATPVARPRGTSVSVREVVLPDRQRQEVTGRGADDHEAIAIGDELFLRGPLAAQIAPEASPEDWLSIATANLPADSELSRLLGGLPHLPGAPLAAIPARLLPQEVRDLGEVDFDGRACQSYGAADTVAATGMRVDYTIAIDAVFLPCFIEVSAGGETQGRNEYRGIDAELEIAAPTAATPVAIPPALATPAARD
jgi:hypothetical protein